MALDVWSEFKEQVRAQTDLVALIGESRAVIPQRGGREFKALCPFHDDHDPSLSINPERQTYRCWSCNEAGDCFSYLMKLEGLDFRQTLEQLAERAGLELPKTSARKTGKPGLSRQETLAVLEWATEQFHQCLLNHPEAQRAREYLFDRGFCEEIWSDFRLGFHPGPWEWLMTRAKGKFSIELLEAARLISPRLSGEGFYDEFRGRVIFPIFNERAQPIAFGGRVLPGSDDEKASSDPNARKVAKYRNSSDSPLFHKSRQLYGIEHASAAMREKQEVLVVEGYTDCIALHQVGMANVVATLGTALTALHVELIRRFCKRVVLIFDGDQAGQTAAQRALPILLAHDIDLKLFAIPENLDPPEFLERHGLQEFQTLLQNASDAWDFKLDQLQKQHGLESDHGRDQIIREMLELLAVAPEMSGTPRENYLLNRLGNRVGLRGVQEHVLRDRLQKLRAKGPRIATNSPQSGQPTHEPAGTSATTAEPDLNFRKEIQRLLHEGSGKIVSLERDLLEIVIMMPECITVMQQRQLFEQISHPILSSVFQTCLRLFEQQQLTGVESLLRAFENPEHQSLLLGLVDRAEQRKLITKLQEQTEFPPGTRAPLLLRQVIEQLEWEYKESHHRNSTPTVVLKTSEPTAVDSRLQQLLQDAALFHQQRVTRKTAST